MSGRQSAWKEVLKEPNAIGWIGLIIVVIAIGVGTVYFSGDNSEKPSQLTTGQAAK